MSRAGALSGGLPSRAGRFCRGRAFIVLFCEWLLLCLLCLLRWKAGRQIQLLAKDDDKTQPDKRKGSAPLLAELWQLKSIHVQCCPLFG